VSLLKLNTSIPFFMKISPNLSAWYTKRYHLLLCVLLLPPLLRAQPVLSSFSPASGSVGTTVIITGTGFGSQPADNIVFFGAVKATVTTAGSTSLSVTVPAGATFQPISITVNKLTGYSARPFVITFPGAGPFTWGSFADVVKFTTELYPYAVCNSDLDGDGKADLAAPSNANVPASSVNVLRNTSTPGMLSFDPKIDLPVPDFPYGITAGDLDGDGKPELAVTYISGNGNVSIYKNNSSPGTLSFAAPLTYGTGSNPYKVEINDIDNDGRPDLVVLNYLGGTISVFRNTSVGGVLSFASKVDFVTGLLPYSICIADLDGDGRNELATVSQQNGTISLFRNTSTPGAIAFAARTDTYVGSSPLAITAGDVDNDGKTDLAAAYYNGFSILRNTSVTGAISFATKVNYPLSSISNGPYDMTMSDMNGDGKPDLVMVDYYGEYISKNNSTTGAISFAAEVTYFTGGYRLAVGDLDGDAKPDMATADFTGKNLNVFRNRITEPWMTSFTPAEGKAGDTIKVMGYNLAGVNSVSFGGVAAASFVIVNAVNSGNVDTIKAVLGNGLTGDVVISNAYGSDRKTGFVFHAPPAINSFSSTSGKTGDTITITGTYFTGATAVAFGGIPAASFTVNSFTTITAVVANGASGNVTVTSPYGTGTLGGFTYYPPPTITSFTPATGGLGTGITITGTNFTGASRVLIGSVPAASFTVQSASAITAVIDEGATGSIVVTALGGTATSADVFTFPPPVITSFAPLTGMPGSTVTITGANFRSDKQANQVFFGASKATVTAASRTSLTVTVPTGATYEPIMVAVNNYIAYANRPFNATYPDGGGGITANSFAWKKGQGTNGEIKQVAMADLDGDGLNDIVYNNSELWTVAALRNTSTSGALSFAPYTNIGTGLNGTFVGMTLGDLNSDGKPDVIVSGYNASISVYPNISTPGNIRFAPAVKIPTAYYGSRSVVVQDFDNDGLADVAVYSSDIISASAIISVYRNTGTNGNISMAAPKDYTMPSGVWQMATADFNGDKKADIAITLSNNTVVVLGNASTPGNLLFTNAVTISSKNAASNNNMTVADFDYDQRPDIATCDYYNGDVTIHRNVSGGGTIAFVSSVIGTIASAIHITAGQLDGDGKPDIAIANGKNLYLFRNTSGTGSISFASPQIYNTNLTYNYTGGSCIGDLDGDGKADIAVDNSTDYAVSFFRNQEGEKIVTACSETSTTLTASSTGAQYLWQVNTGSGYANISNNQNYSGVSSASLVINGTPALWNGYQYHCLVDGVVSVPINLVVNPTIRPTGKATSEAMVCATRYSTFKVTFSSANTPALSTIELWRSINGGPFTYMYSDTYYGVPRESNMTADTTNPVTGYYYVIKPPASVPCSWVGYSDTTYTKMVALKAPVLSVNGYLLTVTNPDTAAQYTWQIQDLSNGWVNVTPAATGAVYKVIKIGNYRVVAQKSPCLEYSAVQAVYTTGIDAVPAESLGIGGYPNPATVLFTIDSLKLSDKWETLDVYRSDGKQMMGGYNIRSRTTVTLSIAGFSNGVCFVVLRRKEKQAVVMKFLKR
jgi:hypothetical protein